MGLDMMMYGRRVFVGQALPPAEQTKDYPQARIVVARELGEQQDETQLAYWRKHPNLHGYIVQTFGGGVDDCQEIPLTDDNIVQILHATQYGSLPETSGFFFGSSDGTEAGDDKAQIMRVLEWLRHPDEPGWQRVVVYQASW